MTELDIIRLVKAATFTTHKKLLKMLEYDPIGREYIGHLGTFPYFDNDKFKSAPWEDKVYIGEFFLENGGEDDEDTND